MSQHTENYNLVAKLGNLKTVVQLLKAINFKESATCYGTSNGLKVIVEDAKCLQGIAYIPVAVFQEYELKEEVVFKINLNVLVECLCMFWGNINTQGSSVALQLFYEGTGHPVTVLIEEDGIITDCSLKTQAPDETLDFHLPSVSALNRVVLKADLLKDALSELDPTSDLVQLQFYPEPPQLKISTDGVAGECQVELPHDGDQVDSYHYTAEASSCYKMSHIKPAMRPLSCAVKVSLSTDDCGLLYFQYMVIAEEKHTCYVEYYISPVVDMDD